MHSQVSLEVPQRFKYPLRACFSIDFYKNCYASACLFAGIAFECKCSSTCILYPHQVHRTQCKFQGSGAVGCAPPRGHSIYHINIGEGHTLNVERGVVSNPPATDATIASHPLHRTHRRASACGRYRAQPSSACGLQHVRKDIPVYMIPD